MKQELLLLWGRWDSCSVNPKLELLQRGPKVWGYPETVCLGLDIGGLTMKLVLP